MSDATAPKGKKAGKEGKPAGKPASKPTDKSSGKPKNGKTSPKKPYNKPKFDGRKPKANGKKAAPKTTPAKADAEKVAAAATAAAKRPRRPRRGSRAAKTEEASESDTAAEAEVEAQSSDSEAPAPAPAAPPARKNRNRGKKGKVFLEDKAGLLSLLDNVAASKDEVDEVKAEREAARAAAEVKRDVVKKPSKKAVDRVKALNAAKQAIKTRDAEKRRRKKGKTAAVEEAPAAKPKKSVGFA